MATEQPTAAMAKLTDKQRAETILQAVETLSVACDSLKFAPPVEFTYNPLSYAGGIHAEYVRRFGAGKKKALLLGMNPGPFGMAQTGVPFGEVAAARDWLGLEGAVGKPEPEHPKRRIEGFGCTRSEVSGRRLWGYFQEKFVTPETFFADHFIVNYCPLVFMGETGKNLTPDKLPVKEREPLFAACDAHLEATVRALEPDWIVGVGTFAEARAKEVIKAAGLGDDLQIGRILHPSPASPAANRDWAGTAEKQFIEQGIWAS